MIIGLIALAIVLYLLYIYYVVQQTPAAVPSLPEEKQPPVPRDSLIPALITNTSRPVVTNVEVTKESTTLDVTPAWYEPIKPPTSDQVRYPANYDKKSPKDVRQYQWLAAYRSMMNKEQKVDFIAQPFHSAVENTETLIAVLGELAHQLDARLTFTDATFEYSDSDYRTACGVGNLGSIHSMIATRDSAQTAMFKLHFKIDYDQVTASSAAVDKFAVELISDIAVILRCKREFIRVFSISRASSINVQTGITTPAFEQTQLLAEQLKQALNQLSPRQRQDVFQYLIREPYTYQWQPVLSFLQLQRLDLDPRYNRDYPQDQAEQRGGRPYYFPQGWYRHALKVDNKYPQDKMWLGMNNSPGEWCVAYHGTKAGVALQIAQMGLKHQFVTADACKSEAEQMARQQGRSIPDVKGLYVATHCEKGAAGYCHSFKVNDSSGATKAYKIVFQCRVENGKFTEHKGPVNVGLALRVFDEKAIRPYGILLKAD